MEERDKKTELLVGLFLFIGIILLGLLILQFSSVREAFKGTYPLTVEFPDGTGIKKDTPIVLSGTKVGKVTDKPKLNETNNGVIVPLAIYQNVKIPTDAKFGIGTAGLLGDSFIQIKADNEPNNEFFKPNDHIKGSPSTGLKNMQETAEELARKVDQTLEDLRSSLKKINEGALSDAAIRDLNESFKHLNNVVTRLDEKTLTDETSDQIKGAVASFKNAAQAMEQSVHKLDPAIAKIDSASGKIDDAASKAGPVLDSANAAMKSIDKNATAVGNTVRDLTKGDGLLPALMKDSQLRAEFQRLVTNLREHGVLFYKDDSGKRESRQQQSQQQQQREQETSRRSRPMTGTKR